MKYKMLIFWVFILLPLLSTTYPQDLSTVLNNYQIKNNISKLRKLTSLRYSGIRSSTEELSFNVIICNGKYRSETKIDDKEYIELFDGSQGYVINHFSDKNNVQELEISSLDFIQMSESSDLEGYLVDPKKKGIRIEYLGKTRIEDKSLYKLKIITKERNIIYYYVGTDDFLIWQKDYLVSLPDTYVTVSIHEYSLINGIYYPCYLETRKNNKLLNIIHINEININIDCDDSLFSL